MPNAVDCTERGPHPVGVTTLNLSDTEAPGRVVPVDLWYPTGEAHRGHDVDPHRGADHPFGQPHAAVIDATPLSEARPLLAFSHGNSGLRRQSTFLTTHLASWGFIVVAPDHIGNTFPEMFGLDAEQRKTVHLDARRNRPRDMEAAIAAACRGGEGLPRVADGQIGVIGHSFGGWTAFKMPSRNARIRAVCGLAPASEPFVGRKAFEPGELPLPAGVRTLIVAGADDVLVDLETSVQPLYARLAAPRTLLAIDGADHFHFCDGIAMLHETHLHTKREGLPRPVRPLDQLLDEARMHRIVRGLVTAFFRQELDGSANEVDLAVRVL